MPAVISTFVLPKIGESHARALFATGERFDAERALRIGLVHEVVADELGAGRARRRAARRAPPPGPTAARAAKALVRELRTLAPDEATRAHRAAHRPAAHLGRGPGGPRAFARRSLEKRPAPRWDARPAEWPSAHSLRQSRHDR